MVVSIRTFFNFISLGGCYVTVKRNLISTPRFDFAAEHRWLARWGTNALPDAINRFGFFMPDHQPSSWFLPMPPPNITGQLHMGHALFLTLQDIQTRFHGLIGDDTLWLPGTDHAGLATHAKILECLEQNNQSSTDLEAYWTKGWEWKDIYHNRITGQIKRMGAACDWSKECFTLDPSYQQSTKEAFRRCWEAGLIYQQDGQWWMDWSYLRPPQ